MVGSHTAPARRNRLVFARSASLRVRLMGLLGAVMFLALLFCATSVIYFVYRTEQAAWHGRQGEASRAAAERVAGVIQQAERALYFLSQMDSARLASNPALIHTAIGTHQAFLEIVRLDADGKVLASASTGRAVLVDLFTIPLSHWFHHARAGEKYIGSVQFTTDGEPYLILALPAMDKGVIVSRLRMEVLRNVVADVHFGEGGTAYVADENGLIVAHTRPQVVMAYTSIAQTDEFTSLKQSPTGEWSGEYVNFENKPVVGVSSPIASTRWILIAELPRSEAYSATLSAVVVLGGSIFIFMIALAFLARAFLNHSVLQPMEQLRNGAERISRGDRKSRLSIARNDEIGQVAQAFNFMVESLSEREQQMAAQAVALSAEITERVQAETALRRSEERYRVIVEDQTELICRFLADGTLTYVNGAYCRFFGKARDELVGHTFIPLIPEEDRRVVETSFSGLSRDNPTVTYTHRVLAGDGEIRWMEWTDRAIFDACGVLTEYQSVGRDITAERLAEEEIKRLNADLERRVLERTEELAKANQELQNEIAERKRIESLIKTSLGEKEMLLKEVHHRVKNNLQIISSLLSLQSGSITDATSLAQFQDSQNRVRTMALIHERLYRSTDLARVDFSTYLSDLAGTLVQTYRSQSSEIELVLDTDAVHLDIDTAIPCGLIVNELVSNALKHAFPGGRTGQLGVGIHNEYDRRTYRLSVWDDGVGIPEGVDVLNSPSLGLQLVNGLVRQLGGTVELRRRNGTRFDITFPAP